VIDLEGIVVPILTPFSRGTDELDDVALRRLVDFLIDAGVQGIIANASTSEFYHLTDDERRREAEIVIEQAHGRVPVLVGAGASGTKLSVLWARHAQSLGADGLLIMPPYYEALSVAQIRAHYATVSEAVPLPIMLYNNPFVAQVLLSPDDLAEIVKVARIPWIKLTTKHIEHIPAILDRTDGTVRVFEGVDSLAFPSMVNGAVGWVAGPANAIPELAVRLWRLSLKEPDLVAAQALQRKLAAFLDFLWDEGVFCSALKEICRMRGYPLGATRAPFSELTQEQLRTVHRFAQDLDLLDVGDARTLSATT
jgi:4-hydroxy-tetrahydrodipicolinate synthase